VKNAKNLYLYIALACFLGLVAIFVVDGYMGTYDTIFMTAGGQEQRDEQIAQEVYDNGSYYESALFAHPTDWGEKIFFRYGVDNRRFQSYSADIEVSLWGKSQQDAGFLGHKVQDLISQQLEIAAFGKDQLEWVVDTGELEPWFVEYSVIIKRGELEGRIILSINNIYDYPTELVPVPAG